MVAVSLIQVVDCLLIENVLPRIFIDGPLMIMWWFLNISHTHFSLEDNFTIFLGKVVDVILGFNRALVADSVRLDRNLRWSWRILPLANRLPN